MSGFPGSPQLRKGALCQGALIIPFQYNPETLTRKLASNAVNNETGTSDSMRIKAPPTESVDLEILLDATDQMERGSRLDDGVGIYPSLSALELLIYPLSDRMIANAALAEVGMIELIPALPLPTLLVWGTRRVVPVRITNFSVTEEAFDPSLNPLRARVSLSLQVLTYEDLGLFSTGGALSMINHRQKERLGTAFMASTDVGFLSKQLGSKRKR